jgi:pimeloyl-ACP methyl ester carboxylesterase
MKRVFLILLLAAAPFAAMAQDITGAWNGTLKAGGQELRIVFNITESDGIYEATMDSPDQGVRGIPMTDITFADGRLKIEAKDLYMMYNGTLKGDVVEGKFTQMAMGYRMDLQRGGAEISRPQTPVPPYPYNSEDVKFENPEAGITLAGTLTYPKGGGGFPAVVLLTGTGAQNRDEEIIGHKPFLVLADYLTRQGIAVLRFDDRGVGESGGDYASATLQDFASDGSAGVDYLKSRPEVDASGIGIIGHSGGGTQAVMLAAERGDIAFIVMLAGAAVKGDVLMAEQRRLIAGAAGVPESAWQENEKLVARIQSVIDKYGTAAVTGDPGAYVDEVIDPAMADNKGVRDMLASEIARAAGPELQSLIKYDPASDLGRVKCPVLALNGDKDLQVPADMNLEAVKKYAGDNATVKKYPGLNHLFQHTATGNIMEYGTIEETMSPEVPADIAEWILGLAR